MFFVVSGRLGRPYLTSEQVQALAADGHEIGGHTCTHGHLPNMSLIDQEDEIGLDREMLQGLGLEPVSFAYPFGEWSPETAVLAQGAGYTSARIVGGINPGDRSDLPAAIPLPVPDTQRYALPTPGSVRRHTTIDDLRQQVDAAHRVGGNLQLVFHHVNETEPVYGIAPGLFVAFLDWLVVEQIRVAPTRDVMAIAHAEGSEK